MLMAAALGYFLGAIPFGLILARLFGHGDIRNIGSGNIGATNVLRTGNKLLALIVLLLDSGKGAATVILAGLFMNHHHDMTIISGFCAVLGHMFPIWLRFKGGKGVATALGMFLALAPTIGIAACLLWLITFLIVRISSLSALITFLAVPPLTHIIYADPTLTGTSALITLLIWLKHRANIKRILTGQEPKADGKKI